MALLSTLTGNFSSSPAWSLGTGFSADTVDPTRLHMNTASTTGFTDTGTPSTYDMTNDTVSWKQQFFPTNNSGGNGAAASTVSVEFRNASTAGTGYRILRTQAGVWEFQKAAVRVGSTWTDLTARYNPWQRLRVASGTTFFEHSADGVTWAQPSGDQNTANYSPITSIDPRFQPSAVDDAGHIAWQEWAGTAPPAIPNDPTIFFMQATSTVSTATIPVTASAPTVVAGELSLLFVGGKGASAGVAPTITTPSGWTIIGTVTNNGTLVSGTDTGSNTIGVYYRTDSGYGSPLITSSGFNSTSAHIIVLRSTKVAAGGSWDVSQFTTGSDTASGANLAITGAAGIAASAGDMILSLISVSGDVGSPSAFLTGGMSGATLLQDTTPVNLGVTTGADSRQIATYTYVTAGSSSSAPTYALTNSQSTTAHGMFLRVRDVAAVTASRPLVTITNPALIRSMTW